MASHQFYRSPTLPDLEIRHSSDNSSCFEPHSHETLSIGRLLSGTATFNYRGLQQATSPDDLCLINPQEIHACRPDNADGWQYLMLYVAADWYPAMLSEGGEKNGRLSFDASTQNRRELVRHYTDTCFALMQQEGLDQEVALLELLDALASDDRSTSAPQRPDCRIALNRSAEYIRANLHQPVSLETLGQISGLSPYHLQRSFRRQYGLSPARFQHQCRIHEACRLLRRQVPIAEVAATTGYADQSHLYRWFRRMMDTTPGQYQQNRPLPYAC
ncbi:AraC family transcriptional regulator [Marinobacterium jannaschii]|uniref:AraC family transcriptional regulator n=1 Tax=Marinobacterium jannaschii TaxID=64970 RepID=UPI00048A18B2|nr:AraC family transcriptional regulator [Marinobacterium jannaschii]